MKGKKKIVIITCAAIGAFLIIGSGANYYQSKSHPTETTMTSNQVQKKTPVAEIIKATDIDSTVAAWKATGLTVSDPQAAFYQMVGAGKGSKYDVDTTNVELYEFSDNTKANNAKSSYFTSSSDTVLVKGTLLIDIHTTDEAKVSSIKAVF